ncbi:hypothetical protein FB451DRAFT_1450317 [Mycena latifolia]|nr:hypothetical protein FB451DRAFT_1450317 [Mycena latifolia]
MASPFLESRSASAALPGQEEALKAAAHKLKGVRVGVSPHARTAPVHPSNSLNAPRTTPRLRPHRGVDSAAPPLPVAEAHNTSQRGLYSTTTTGAPYPTGAFPCYYLSTAPSHRPRPSLASRQRPRGCLLTQAKEANEAERECPSALVPPPRHRHAPPRLNLRPRGWGNGPPVTCRRGGGAHRQDGAREGMHTGEAHTSERRGPAAFLSGGVPAERTRPHPATAQVWLLMSAIAQLEDAEDSKYQ